MLTKTPCQHCGTNIEFDVENANEFVPCPLCGQQTRLLMPARKQPATSFPASLRPCGDCGKVVSVRAVFCPACGGFNRIPFRLVWQAVCLVLFVFGLLEIIQALIHLLAGFIFP